MMMMMMMMMIESVKSVVTMLYCYDVSPQRGT